ncbi:lamin tail domain-containing protein [Cryptosporangium arvum]|uniref:lamin tail domain-containing protein n=1 Tax=Cryptosporangium arvum TaxID=80871 RepID=UPI0004ADDC73|nr:lamin tail domain-containing protein [Cryptosporangium arvum]
MRLIPGLTSAATAAAAVVFALVPASPAAAAPVVQFTRSVYNSPGADTRTNSSLNAEYLTLKNTGKAPVDLNRWTVRDKANHVYTFAGNVTVQPGATLWLHTGRGTDDASHRYWNSGNYIWNNTGDTAYLRDPAGTQIDTCSWKKGTQPVAC